MKIDFRWQIQQITEGFWKFLEGFDLVITLHILQYPKWRIV